MLSVEAIETFYGPSQALFGVSLEVGPGQMVALLGRNGMGKTTTIRSILAPGAAGARQGRVRGHRSRRPRCLRDRAPRHRPRARGPARVRQSFRAGEPRRGRARRGPWTLAGVYALFPHLRERAGSARPDALRRGAADAGDRPRAHDQPEALLLDEATEGLAPLIRREIWRAIAKLKAEGLALLLVDKNLQELLPLADRCVVLEKGRSVWTGAAAALAADRELQNRHLGV